MKKLLLFILFLTVVQSTFAQTELFKKGQIDLQVGTGFINSLDLALDETGFGDASFKFVSPPPVLSVDYGITDEISVGGYLNYTDSKFTFPDGSLIERDKILFIGARGLYHFDMHPKFDTYGGLGLAYGSITASNFFDSDSGRKVTKGDIFYQAVVGGRYRFTKIAGAFVEIGYGITVINLGLNLKL